MNKVYAKLSTGVFFSCILLFTSTILAQQSLYNGQIPISIPIHTVDNGRTQVPIRLDYDGSGVKPNQHPGWTGMNWGLSAGGVVTREVKSVPDDFYAWRGLLVGSALIYGKAFTSDFIGDPVYPYTVNNLENNVDSKFPDRLGSGMEVTDLEPDVFRFTLPNGTSGEFYLKSMKPETWILKGNKKFSVELLKNATGPLPNYPNLLKYLIRSPLENVEGANNYPSPNWQLVDKNTSEKNMIPSKDDRIGAVLPGENYSNSFCFKGFKITTDDGNVYLFGNGDVKNMQFSKPFFQQHTAHWQVDAWYLVKMTSPDGEDIIFSYDDALTSDVIAVNPKATPYINSMVLSKSDIKFYDCNSKTPTDCNSAERPNVTIDPSKDGVYSGLLIKPTYLKQIKSRTEIVNFVRTPSIELEYDYKIYEKYFDFFISNIKFSWYDISGRHNDDDYKFTWCPFLNNSVTNYPNLGGLTKEQYIKQNWTNNLTFYKLSEIQVLSVKDANSERLKYKLNYNSDSKIYPGSHNETDRLQLQSVSKVSGTKTLDYSFEYDSRKALPSRYLDPNGLVDHWGFFNDRSFNIETENSDERYWNEYFDSREATMDESTAMAGSLKSITLPTGGKIKYNFEQNKHSYGYQTAYEVNTINPKDANGNRISGGLRIASVINENEMGIVTGHIKYRYVYDFKQVGSGNVSSGIRDLRYDYYIRFSGSVGTNYIYENFNLNRKETFTSRGRLILAGGTIPTPPVSYSEVAIENADKSYTVLQFTNFFNKNNSSWVEDEEVEDNQRLQRKVTYEKLSPQEPIISHAFERGLIISETNYDSNDLIVLKKEYSYGDISNRETDYINGIETRNYPGKSDSQTNWGAVVTKALVTSIVPYGSWIDMLLTGLNIDWGPSTSTVQVRSTNFGYVYKIYTQLYGLKRDITTVYDLKDATRTTFTTTTNDYNYNKFGTIGQLNEVITTLPIDNINASNFRKTELISKTKFASDYDNSTSVCAIYAKNIYDQCINNGDDIAYCNNLRISEHQSCLSGTSEEVLAIDLLNSKKMYSYPIENVTIRKTTISGSTPTEKTLSGNINIYKNYSINGQLTPMLKTSFSLANDNSLSSIYLSNIEGKGVFHFSNRYLIKNISIDNYDSQGNPSSIISRSGITQNISYDSYNYPSTQSIQDAPSPGSAGVGSSSFTFSHLRGLTSSVDDNGKIINYTYDGFNRLKTISDNENNILKSYAYNLPFSNFDATKADKAPASETTISSFAQLEECKPVKSYCDIEATIKPFDAVTSCTNGTVQLFFDPDSTTTGTGVKYSWTGPNNFKSTELSPIISDNLMKASGVYTLTVTRDQCKSSASASSEILIDCNCTNTINTNGSTVDNLTCDSDVGATIKLFANCTGCSGEIVAGQETYVTNGKFEVFEPSNPSFSSDYDKFSVNNPQMLGGVFRSFGDHSTGNGNMIVIGHSETPNLRLYYITINNLKPKTRYQVSGWLAGATDNNPNIMFFEMNGVRLVEEVSFLTSQGGIWKQLKSYWTTGETQTSVTLAVRKRGVVGWNWIALDDISLTEAPSPEFFWTGPNDYSSTLQNPEIRNATAKNAGTYFLSVLDKNCVKSIKTNVAINCPACTQPISVITSSNTPVSADGIIKLKSTTEDGVSLTWFGRNITASNKKLPNPEIPIDWIVKDGGETETYYVEAYKNGCTDNSYAEVKIIKNAIPAGGGGLAADLALRIRREDGGTGIEAGETARFCADVNNAGPNNAYDVTFRVVIPPCLDLVDLDGSGSSGSVSGPEWDYGQKQRAWYNSTTRELSNMCTANPNQAPPYRNVGDCWRFRGAEMGGDWTWNGWNTPSAADLKNFSPHTFTKSMCFSLRATQKSKFIIKGEVMSSLGEGYQEIVDPDSFAGDGIENGQDDRAELILNDSYDILTVSKERFAVGNRGVPVQTFSVSTKVSPWTITLIGTNTSWVTVTPMSATGSNGTLKTTNVQFTVADNTSAFSRYLTIVVKSTCGDEKRINVKQAGSIECPAGLIATASTPVVCGSTINLGATIRPLQEVNLIDNPDFESGNVGFSGGAWTYYNGTSGTRAYVVDENPKSIMWFTKSSCPGIGDLNSGSGKMMGVNGSYTANGFFWSQTVNVDRYTDYDLSVKAVQLGTYDNSGIVLEYYVNGTPTGVKGTISTIGCTWGNITGKWYSGEFFGPITLSLRIVNSSNGESMFGIDDLSLKLSKNGRMSDETAPSYSWMGPGEDALRLKPASGFMSSVQNPTIPNAGYKNDGLYTVTATRSGCSVTSSVGVVINCPSSVCVAPSIVMTPVSGIVCGNLNQSVLLTVNGCSGTILWTDNPTTGISQNPRTITQTTIGNYSYKARCVSECGISPESVPAIVTVKGTPIAPILANVGPIKICPGNNITISATCPTGTTTTWNSNYPGANTTGSNYTLIDGTNINASTPVILSVTCVDACGISLSRTINASVENSLAAVKPTGTVDKPRMCLNGGNVSLAATGCPINTTYTWYKVGQAASIGVGTPLTVSVTASASFKVRCEQQTCLSIFSNDISVDVRTTIPAAPSTPTLASGQSSSICQNTPITINASACSEAGSTLVWSTNDENVSSISWQSAVSGTFNISVKCKSDIGCLSNSSGNLTLMVVGGPTAPTDPCLADDPGCTITTICKTGGVTIYGGACSTGATSVWYNSIDNINFTVMTGITTSDIYVTPVQTTRYKVACKNSCATGNFASRTVTVNVVDKPATPSIVSPAIDMTSYSCTSVSIYSNRGACEGAGFSLRWYKNNVMIPGATDWNYNATSSGTYKVKCINTNNPSSCQESDISSGRIILIESSPPTPTLSVSTNICGAKVLTSSDCGTGLTYKWYNVDTEITGETRQTYTAGTSSTYSVRCVDNRNTNCKEGGRTLGVAVTVTFAPAAPTISSNVTEACSTTLTKLIAQGCSGGTITWSNGSIGSALSLKLTATTTFKATCNNGACTSGDSNGITVSLKTTDCPPDICSSSLNSSGGDEGFDVTYAPMSNSGTLEFGFNPYSKEDKLIVYKNDVEAINSNCIGNNRINTYTFSFINDDIIRVKVEPNCTGGAGTAWYLSSSCSSNVARQVVLSNEDLSIGKPIIVVKDFNNKLIFESLITSKESDIEKILKEKGLKSGNYKVEIIQNGKSDVKNINIQTGSK